LRKRGSVWHYNTGANNLDRSPDSKLRREGQHPATFPLQLALDHVLCWTNPGDLVLDPMIGSGTTAVACLQEGRRCIGYDMSSVYLEVAQKRVDLLRPALRKRLAA
jgi:DNA modification methylase